MLYFLSNASLEARKAGAEFSLETVGLFVILNPFNSIQKQKFLEYFVHDRPFFIFLDIIFSTCLQFCNLIILKLSAGTSPVSNHVFLRSTKLYQFSVLLRT